MKEHHFKKNMEAQCFVPLCNKILIFFFGIGIFLFNNQDCMFIKEILNVSV